MFKRQFKISFRATYNNLGSCEEEINEDNSCFTQSRAFDFEKTAVVFALNNCFTTINAKKRYGLVYLNSTTGQADIFTLLIWFSLRIINVDFVIST